MSPRRHLTLVAAGATLLASMPLATVFESWSWFIDGAFAVGLIVAVGLLLRSLRAPAWAPTAGMLGMYLLVLTWLFHSGHEFLGLLPSPATFRHFNDLLVAAGTDMRDMGVPVQDRDGLLLLSTLGIGAVAILVDLFAVVMRRPALAGLPMLAIYSVPVAVHQDSVSFLPFAAGAAGFLWLLVTDNVDRVRRFGRRFTGDGRDVDLWEPSPLAAAGRRLALVGVLVAVMLPLALPVSSTGLLDRFGSAVGAGGTGTGRGSGSGASVNLYAVLNGELNADKTFDMAKVQTDDPNPYYMRFGVADRLANDGFHNRAPGGGQSAAAGMPAVISGPGITARQHRATVQVFALDMSLLPIYLQPTKTEKLDSSWLYDRTNQLVYSRRANARGKKYSFEFARLDYSVDALRSARPLAADDPIQREYTATPKVAEVERKVAQITAGKSTPYDKVRAIHGYFSADNDFKYSLQTKSGTSGSAIVDFLNNKQGFCEQYSAAMAWLVRAAGIPARVAFGFSRGAKSGDTWTMTNRNLHAWTEVYFDRLGWVPFDATPSAYVNGVDSAWAPDPSKPQTAPGGAAPGTDLPGGPAPDTSGSAGANDRQPEDRLGDGAGGTPLRRSSQPWPMWTTLGVLTMLALVFAPAVWRVGLRRRRSPDRLHGPPPVAVTVAAGSRDVEVTNDGALDAARRRAHAAWEELVDTMVDYRIPVDPAATPRVTSEHVIAASALAGPAATGARLLGQAEERASYAREPLDDPQLAGSLRLVRSAIRRRVSLRTRLRAALLPASVLERWRMAIADASASTTQKVTGWRDTAVRLADPRRLLHRSSS
jgi:transglutaminase-like putative cysteine protease